MVSVSEPADRPVSQPAAEPVARPGDTWIARLRRHPYLPGALAAALSLAVATLPMLLWPALAQDDRGAVLVFGVVSAVGLAWLVRHPVVALAGAAAVLVVAAAVGIRFTPWVSNAGPALPLAVFSVALLCPRKVALPAAVTAVAAVCGVQLAALLLRWYPGHDQEAIQLLLAAPAFMLGTLLRDNASYRAALAAERDERVRADERLRLSRDVHDVVSHSLSAIAVQAGSGRMLAASRPQLAAAALADIEQTSRSALGELREVLRDWRSTARPAGRPSLADLPNLSRLLTPAGRYLELTVDGTARELPAPLETAVYRIAQEAVTNASRHSRADTVRLTLTHRADGLELEVTDDGPAVAAAPDGPDSPGGPGGPGGHGLAGMRERVTLLGGQLTAGRRAPSGFAVLATIPLPSNDSEPEHR